LPPVDLLLSSGLRHDADVSSKHIALASLCALLGCGSSVTIQAGDDDDSVVPGPAPCRTPPGPQAHDFVVDDEGSWVAGRLHLTGTLDGSQSYLVGELLPSGLWLRQGPSALEGPARWRSVDGTRYARVRSAAETAGLAVEVLDASSPDDPEVADAFAVAGDIRPGADEASSVLDGSLLFCHLPQDVPDPDLVAVDLATGTFGSAQLPSACSSAYDVIGAAGSMFFSWTAGGGITSASIAAGDAATKKSLVSFGFATNGVHAYGPIVGAASDGERLVVSPKNDGWMLVFDDAGQDALSGPYVPFGPSGPKRLLAVAERSAYFAVPSGVVAYDLTELDAPTLLEPQASATAGWEPTSVRLVVVTPTDLLLQDADGRILRAPRDVDAPIEELAIYSGEPQVDPCE
jgi:hypothetical protein